MEPAPNLDRPLVPAPLARGRHGAVVAPHHLATAAGLGVLRAGGSAVDAAIATNAALAVVMPNGCGIGGDAFWLIWDAEAGRLFNVWVDEHDRGQLAGCPVLLLMDAFEHAYMGDYGTKRGEYIDAFLAAADWGVATRRFEMAETPAHAAAHA